MTVTSPSVVDEDAWSVRRSVVITASRSKVWSALTEPSQIALWFGQRAEFDRVEAGAAGVFGWGDHGDYPALITEFEPESVFAFRWGTPGQPLREDNSTVARFTLTDGEAGEDGDSTVLEVVETGFSSLLGDSGSRLAQLDDHRDGWDSEIDELIALVTSTAASGRSVGSQ